jgi:hypothetical protein
VVLSGEAVEPGAEPLPPAHEIAEKIKSLKAANTIEVSAGRSEARGPMVAVEPVTTRIRRRMPKPIEPENAPEADATTALAEASVPAAEKTPEVAEPISLPQAPLIAEPALPGFDDLPQTSFTRYVARPKRRVERQLNMF